MIYIFRGRVLVSDTFMSRDLYNCTHCRSTLWSSKHKEKGCAWVIKAVDICAVWMEINVFTLALSNLSLGWDISHCTFTSKWQNTLFMLGSIYIALLDRFLTKAIYGYKYMHTVWSQCLGSQRPLDHFDSFFSIEVSGWYSMILSYESSL